MKIFPGGLALLAALCLTSALTAQAAPPSSPSNVNVVNTPNVNVANTPANPAHSAVQQQIIITLVGPSDGSGTASGSGSVTIPAGKIFVLQFTTFSASGGSIVNCSININGPHIDGSNGPISYPLQTIGGNILMSNQVVFLYAQPGTTIVANFSVIGLGIGQAVSVAVNLSGYFVNQ